MTSLPVFPSSSDLIAWWARVAPARVAIVDKSHGGRYSYADLEAAAERWVRALARLGVGNGDRVATLTGNRVETITLYFAAIRLGAVLVPLNWRLAAPELSRVLSDAAPSIVVGEDRFRGLAEPALASSGVSARWIDIDRDARSLSDRSGGVPPTRVDAEPDAPAMMLYTSGSTGRPKGAILPHRQIFYNAIATTTGWQLGADDVAIVANPLFHTGGWHVFSTPLWHRGGTIVLFDQFEPTAFLDALAEERVTVAFSVPTQISMLTQSPSWGRELPSLRFLISGGAPCPRALGDRVRAAGMSFREGYGLTECGPNCFTITDDEALRRPGAVGWPSPFLQMKLDDGELLLRGPQMFGGYYNDPARTAEAIDADGWLHTGDLAIRDDDGAYRICGRKKDMFISGGENVYPGEVEAALSECPGVGEAVVVGVPDMKWGEVGRAFVVRRQGESLTPEQIVAHARTRLAGYKVPKSVVLVDELPRLGSGKADRSALRQLAIGG